MNSVNRLGQHGRDRELYKFVANRIEAATVGNGIGCDDLGDRCIAESLKGETAEHGVRCGRNDAVGAAVGAVVGATAMAIASGMRK